MSTQSSPAGYPGEPRPIPPLVARAIAAGCDRSCAEPFGRLLRTLAAAAGPRVLAEIGTGVGVGAAWIASGMQPGARLLTVEADAARAASAASLFADAPAVTVIHGDWREMQPLRPFALIGDVTAAKTAPEVVEALAPGGIAVIDDLAPEEHWPPEWRGPRDPVRDFWLGHPALAAAEVRLTATTAAIGASAGGSPIPTRPPDPRRTGGSR